MKRQRIILLRLASLMFILGMSMGGCRRAPTSTEVVRSNETATAENTKSPTAIGSIIPASPTAIPYPMFTSTGGVGQEPIPYPNAQKSPTAYPAPLITNIQPVTQAPEVSQTQRIITQSPTITLTAPGEPGNPSPTSAGTQAYPGPQGSPTNPSYPGPQVTATSPSYPGPSTPTPRASRTPPSQVSPTATPIGTVTATPTGTQITGTPRTTPTEKPPQPPLSPPPAGSDITIWHSWGIAEANALQSIIDSFKRLYPDVTFRLLYIPEDELYDKYHDAAYLGDGPSLLLGPSAWGPKLAKETLVKELQDYTPQVYLENINSAALDSGYYNDALISLPLSQHGLIMFRNSSVVSNAPANFDELITLSHEATHGGLVGTYLERGAYFSSPSLIGLGGRLINEYGVPAFNDSFGLEWFNLLEDFDVAGAVTFNTNRDLDMFKRGKVGIIIDGSWNITTLAQAIGQEKLVIDEWPSYGTGHLSGWVLADNAYINQNASEQDFLANLAFIGYLLDPDVQVRLAEVGHIPSVNSTQPRDPFIKQAMIAFEDGVPYPNTVDDPVMEIYWQELDKAIANVFQNGIDPTLALKQASENITKSIINLQAEP